MGTGRSPVRLPETAPLPAASAKQSELSVLHRARGPTKSPGSRIYRGGGGARLREAPPPLAHSWNNVTKIMNGFGARSSRWRRLGGALGSAPRGQWFAAASSPAPTPRLTHANTRVAMRARTQTHARGPEFNVNATSDLQSRGRWRPAPLSLHTPPGPGWGDLGAEDRGVRRAPGPAPDVTAWRGERAPSLNQRPLWYPLAVPGPHLGTPLQRTSPKLGFPWHPRPWHLDCCARDASLLSLGRCVQMRAQLKKRQWEGGRGRGAAGPSARGGHVSLQGTGLQP